MCVHVIVYVCVGINVRVCVSMCVCVDSNEIGTRGDVVEFNRRPEPRSPTGGLHAFIGSEKGFSFFLVCSLTIP